MPMSAFFKESLPNTRTNLDRFKLAIADIAEHNGRKGLPPNAPPFSPKQKQVIEKMMMKLDPAEQQEALMVLSQKKTPNAV